MKVSVVKECRGEGQEMNESWKYKTHADAPLRAEPNPDSIRLDTIPSNTVLESKEKKSYWIKVEYNGQAGWATTALMDRIMNEPAPDLEFHSNGFKIIKGVYRYFFGINNAGTQEFRGTITLRLYGREKLILTETYLFANNPILSPGGRSFYEDANELAFRYEFETSKGKHASGEITTFTEESE